MHKLGLFFGTGFTLVFVVFFSAEMIQDALADSYTDQFFGSFNGKYNDKNGAIFFTGNYKHTYSYNGKITGIGQLKYFDWEDSSIPQCKRAFVDDFTLHFGDGNYGRIHIKGKICDANWDDTWKIFYGTYTIYDGHVKHAEKISSTGIIEFVINTDTNKLSSGKLNGLLTITT